MSQVVNNLLLFAIPLNFCFTFFYSGTWGYGDSAQGECVSRSIEEREVCGVEVWTGVGGVDRMLHGRSHLGCEALALERGFVEEQN